MQPASFLLYSSKLALAAIIWAVIRTLVYCIKFSRLDFIQLHDISLHDHRDYMTRTISMTYHCKRVPSRMKVEQTTFAVRMNKVNERERRRWNFDLFDGLISVQKCAVIFVGYPVGVFLSNESKNTDANLVTLIGLTQYSQDGSGYEASIHRKISFRLSSSRNVNHFVKV